MDPERLGDLVDGVGRCFGQDSIIESLPTYTRDITNKETNTIPWH